MRDIKFRAWDKRNKKMIEWEDFDMVFSCDALYDLLCGELPIYIPIQFTGLRDKNGREIYEGDVVSNGMVNPYIAVIEYNQHKACFYYTSESETAPLWTFWKLEIIGNIHEHPELLNNEVK